MSRARTSRWITILLAALLPGAALVAATAATPAQAAPAIVPAIVDVPVSFTVTNTNRSKVPCPSDGKTYTLRGHLTGPATALASADADAVTLYLHGLELGEWFWRAPVEGYNHAEEMARLGHVSLTIDRLGYGESDHGPGLQTCVGSHADMAHQVVQQLRSGAYDSSVHPSFARVGLAGHSLGGAIAEVEAYSFDDVDGVAILSYSDLAITASGLLTTTGWGPTCLLGGKPTAKGAKGYTFFTHDAAEFQSSFLAHSDAAVRTYAAPRRAMNPCGDLLYYLVAAVVNGLSTRQIDAPVLLLTGRQDKVFDAARFPLQKLLFGPAATLAVVDGATHGITLEPTAVDVREQLSGWLTTHDL